MTPGPPNPPPRDKMSCLGNFYHSFYFLLYSKILDEMPNSHIVIEWWPKNLYKMKYLSLQGRLLFFPMPLFKSIAATHLRGLKTIFSIFSISFALILYRDVICADLVFVRPFFRFRNFPAIFLDDLHSGIVSERGSYFVEVVVVVATAQTLLS